MQFVYPPPPPPPPKKKEILLGITVVPRKIKDNDFANVFFFVEGVGERAWNSLPHSIKHSTSAQQFKRFLHAHYKTRLSFYRPP